MSKASSEADIEKPVKMIQVESSNCLSDVDVKLSHVHLLLSEINQTMSNCHVPFVQSRKLLPRYNFILSEIKSLVSWTQDCPNPVDVYDDGDSSWWWDDNKQYYNLNANLSFSSITISDNNYHDAEGDNDAQGWKDELYDVRGDDHDDDDAQEVDDEKADEVDISKIPIEHEEDVDMIPVDHEVTDMKISDNARETIDDTEDEDDNIATRVMARRRLSIYPDDADWSITSPEAVDGSFIYPGDVDSHQGFV